MTDKYNISTQRTVLRLVEEKDLDALHALHSIPEVDAFNTLGIPKNIEETKAVLAMCIEGNRESEINNYTYAITLKDSDEFIGLFGYKLASKKYQSGEVWYKLHPSHWGKGIATEVLRTMLDFGFETLQLHRIVAGCAVDNIGSIKVLERVGMIKEGRCRQLLPLKTGWSDNFEYAMLASDKRK